MNELPAVLLLSLLGIGIAGANTEPPGKGPTPIPRGPRLAAPEIDPSSGLGAATLPIGGLCSVDALPGNNHFFRCGGSWQRTVRCPRDVSRRDEAQG
jgi:hypothetical protein